MNNKDFKALLVSGALGLGVCTGAGAEAPTALSSFIEGDVPLQPHPDLAKVYRYFAPDMDLKKYDRVMFEPIEIWVHEKSKCKGFNADDMKALSDRFLAVMQDELEPEYPVVSKPGPGVAVARVAISGVKLKKKKRGLLGYTPVGFVATSALNAAGKRVSLVDATIEAEVLDGASNERVAVLVDFSFTEDEKASSFGDLEARFRLYGKRFRSQLDQAHGRPGKQYSDVMPSILDQQ